MDALERAAGPKYDIGADPAEAEWVTTREARFERERASRPIAIGEKLFRQPETRFPAPGSEDSNQQ